MATLARPLEMAQELVARVLRPGDTAIDATVGNGHDTLFLAHRVGAAGKVYGFDIQQAALAAARRRLAELEDIDNIVLLQQSHESMAAQLPAGRQERLRAVMFNLGYLPGGDKSIITRPASSLAALAAAADLLAPDGIISIVAYTGHPGGAAEARAVAGWAGQLDRRRYRAARYDCINEPNNPPFLLAIERLAADNRADEES